jgi:hypothetical protein
VQYISCNIYIVQVEGPLQVFSICSWSSFGLPATRVFHFPEQGYSVGLDIAKRSCARGNIGKAKWLNELEDREGRLAGLPPFSTFHFSGLHLTDTFAGLLKFPKGVLSPNPLLSLLTAAIVKPAATMAAVRTRTGHLL